MSLKQKGGLPRTLTLQELARALGLSLQRINQLEREGAIKKLGRDTYPVTAIADYCEGLRATISGGGAGIGLTDQRAELVRERILMARLEREAMEGKWLPTDQVERAWGLAIATSRQHFLAIPAKSAPQLAAATTPQECFDITMQFVRDALTAASEDTFTADTGADRGKGNGGAA